MKMWQWSLNRDASISEESTNHPTAMQPTIYLYKPDGATFWHSEVWFASSILKYIL